MPRDTPPPTGQVFLSYSRTDREACIALRSALEQAGLSIFQDEDAIRIGDRWVTRLQEALQACSAFLVLIGRDGVRRWVGAEVEIALTRHLSPHNDKERLPIFPILLAKDARPEGLPPFLALFQSTPWSPTEPLPSALLEAIKNRAIRLDEPPPFDGCPFLGLNAFRRADARLFFGRRKETLEALAALGDQRESNPERLHGGAGYHRWLQIEGNSGAGKSSLVNAGMLPVIERGALWARTGFERWRVLGPMMPGKDPMAKLAEVLELGLVEDQLRRDSLALQRRLEKDERALARRLRDFKEDKTAFLLIVDQFEELYTFADDAPRKRFDALLANALEDPECPLFLITTVRADFLDRLEHLPRLQAIYNTRCKRYFLPTISEHGLREVIEEPARLAGLDVSEVKSAMLQDAREEIGALPLVENALSILWQQREDNRLSGERYRQQHGIAGMLSAQADALLEQIDLTVPKGKRATLELLLRLTRINDEGRHTRQRITREEAVDVAGEGKDAVGERVAATVRRASPRLPGGSHNGALRLIITSTDQDVRYVDLIHETLIRARGKDEKTGKRIGYWPTLYGYIEANRDRDLRRQQLKLQAEQWAKSKGLSRWRNLAGLRERRQYRRLRVRKHSPESRYVFWSRWKARAQLALLVAILGVCGESAWWATQNSLPFGYVLIKPLWVLGLYTSLPDMVEIPTGTFTMGCVEGRDDVVEDGCGDDEKPAREITIARPFTMGQYEVTFLQYDYYVWSERREGNVTLDYPSDSTWGRFDRPVIDVSWDDAKAYVRWLSDKTGKSYRLPTEAEWEYAARAGTDTAYWWGKTLAVKDANCIVEGSQWGGKKTAPVGRFPANPWGLYDTMGNIWEWVEDPYGSYERALTDGSAWEDEKSVPRVLRGGSWDHAPGGCRAASRGAGSPASRGRHTGFRVCGGAPIEYLRAEMLITGLLRH